jgi:hypothetical protein
MGKIAALQILNHKDNNEIITNRTTVLDTELIIRESSMRSNQLKKPLWSAI